MTLKKTFTAVLTFLALAGTSNQTIAADIAFSPTEDGLYAVFSTNKGEFAAKLYYDQVPITVANFVGLAEGSVLRWDIEDKKPIAGHYYDGIAFHRVISGFMIQGGSPNGLGTDGPGYSIPDEITPNLTHSKAGMLSMAKSGPNSGGSQFFITLAATSWLDGVHTVFGEIAAGQSVVDTIGATPTDSSDKPLSDVVINEITILRIGTEAKQFDPRNYDVPNVLFPKLQLDLGKTQSVARFDRKKYADYLVRQSTNLSDWEVDESLLASYSAPLEQEIDLTNSVEANGKLFIEVTEVTSPHTIDAAGTNLTVNLGEIDPITIELKENFVGSYTFASQSSNVTGYLWYPLESRDQLHISYDGLRTMQIYFTWTSETQGTAFVHVLESYTNAQDQFNLTGTVEVNQRPSRD